MALSGSALSNIFTAPNGQTSRLRFEWTATQSIANNTSLVSYKLIAVISTGWVNAESFQVVVNGSTKNDSDRRQIRNGDTVLSGSVTVQHGTNGKGSFSYSFGGAIYNFGSRNVTGAGSGTLNNIPRESTFTIPSSFTMGDAFTVSISRADSSFTHWVRLSDGNTVLFDTDSSVGTSQSVNVAASTLIARMAGVKSKTFTVTVWTYSGSTVIGNTSKTITANIPTSTFTIPSSFTVGKAFTVSVSRVGSLTHELELIDGSTIVYSSGNNVTTSSSPNVSASTLIARMSGVASKAFTVKVRTFNGSTRIGSTSKTITANIPISTFTIPSSFTVGSAFTVSISRVGSLTHQVAIRDGGTSYWYSDSTIGSSGSVNVPADTLTARMLGVVSKVFTVRVATFNGSTSIGSTSKTIKANIPISTFTIPSSFTMGNAFNVSISRVGSLTHSVSLIDGDTQLYREEGKTTSDSINVALSTLAGRSPNAMSKSFTVNVSTYSGSTRIGNNIKTITGNVPSTVKPTFSAVTVSENVSSVASLVGAYVQTKSKLNLAITGASGIYGSTIKSYNITGVGHNVNTSSTVTGFVSVSGNQTIKGTVTDSRGQSFEKSVVVNILPYTPPILSDLSFRRTLPDKTEAPLGDNATVTANVKVHSLIVNGVEKNHIKYNVQSAQSGGSFADKANTTSTGLTKSYSDVGVGYSVDHSYNFRVRVGDVFGFGGWSVGVIPTGVVTQQWGSKTTSFGKMIDDTSYNVQVGTGGIQSDGIIEAQGINLRTKPLVIYGNAADQMLITRGISGSDGHGNVGDLHINSGTTDKVYINGKVVSVAGHTHAARDITSGTIADARLPAKAKPADYVIEQGSNYTKWNSGKLEQWGFIDLSSSIKNTAGSGVNFTINRPISPVNSGIPTCTPVLYDEVDGAFSSYEASLSLNTSQSGYYRIVKTRGGAFGNGLCGVTWSSIDRWK